MLDLVAALEGGTPARQPGGGPLAAPRATAPVLLLDDEYEPAVPREQMQQRLAGDLMQRVFGGSAKGLILGALGVKRVADDELAEIRRMIDGLDRKKRGKK